VLELVCLIEVAIGLAPGDGTSLGEALGGLGQVRVFPQQSAGQVEPLGFLGIAGAGHMTYKYAYLCHKSRTLSSPFVLLLLSKRRHPLKLEVIFCVQAVSGPPCGVPSSNMLGTQRKSSHAFSAWLLLVLPKALMIPRLLLLLGYFAVG
jgi:hypothetical protein